jgi:pyruvate dehydrogenase E2 component (dihydrolipoamide acetyltransferase)
VADPETQGTRGTSSTEEPTRAQQLIARRVAESRATVPDATYGVELDVEGVPDLRGAVVHAWAQVLRDDPKANGAYRDAQHERYGRVNVGVVVSTDDAFAIPTIFDADGKGAADIERELDVLAEQARAGALTAPALRGATTTVWTADVQRFAGILVPGQGTALALGAAQPRAVVRDGGVVVRSVAEVTLTCDARLLHPADAATLLRRLQDRVAAG